MYQKLTVVGYLGGDPELRFLPSGTAVCNFSIASNRTYTKDNEQVKETTWFRVSVWGNQGENANKYLAKGSRVLVEGRLKPDPDTGNPRLWVKGSETYASFEVDAQRVVYLSPITPQTEGVDNPETDYIPF